MVTTIETVPGTPSSSPIPPVAAEPATIIYDYKRGWTGRARSISVIPAAGTFTFTVPASTVGAMVGMTAEPRSEGFADILFGFYVNRGAVRIYESGVDVLSVGAFPNAELAITREGGFIRYFVNGTMVRERPNESAPLYLGASLYMAGDAVDDAEIETFASGGGSATFLPMQAIGGSVAYAFGSASFLPMTAEGSQDRTGSGAATFPVMQAFGNGPGSYYATGGASFLPMTSAGDAYGLEPTYGVGLAQFQPMVAGGFGYTGTVGSGAATFEPLFAVGADRPYAYGASRFEPMLSYGENYLGENEVVVYSEASMDFALTASTDYFVVMNSAMEFVGLLTAQAEAIAEMLSAFTASTSMTTQLELLALMTSLMRADTLAESGDSGMTVWALHTDAGGSTRYENYDFNSFAKIGDHYYGAKSDGIYKLEGRDDDGQDVESRINFGQIDFGTIERKAMPYVYVGIASDGRLRLKVVADGSTYYYNLRSTPAVLKAERFELGRGLRASYYELELIDVGGVAFELSEIEFFPVKLSRRL
jgi:hypothetical protein